MQTIYPLAILLFIAACTPSSPIDGTETQAEVIDTDTQPAVIKVEEGPVRTNGDSGTFKLRAACVSEGTTYIAKVTDTSGYRSEASATCVNNFLEFILDSEGLTPGTLLVKVIEENGDEASAITWEIALEEDANDTNDSVISSSSLSSSSASSAPDLDAFSGAFGEAPGEVVLTLDFPSDTSEISKVQIRRAAGSQAPDDCSSGDLTAEITSSFSDQTVTDFTYKPGSIFSYRACILDSEDIASSGTTAENIASRPYRIFVSSIASHHYSAQSICDSDVQANGLSGSWTPLNLSQDLSATLSLVEGAIVTNFNGDVLVNSAPDLWSTDTTSLINPVKYEADGTLASASSVWTGSNPDGTKHSNNCFDWSTTEVFFQGRTGDPMATTSSWLDNANHACSSWAPAFYCMSKLIKAPIRSFNVSTGASSDGDIDISFILDLDMTRYSKIQIRRVYDDDAPSSTCAGSSDDIIRTYEPPSSASVTLTDSTGSNGTLFSYRLCAWDSDFNLSTSAAAESVTSKGTLNPAHRIFITSSTYTGNLGGASGADTYCSSAASSASLPGTWKALLSTSSTNMKDRISISGHIYNTNNRIIATSSSDLFDKTHHNKFDYDEHGANVTTNLLTYTGSSNIGTKASSTCSDYTSSSAETSINFGLASDLGTGDSSNGLGGYGGNCSQTGRIICISQ